jgi:hypothetical protein
MSLFKSLLMVVILLALGAYIYFVELPRDQEETAKKKLFTFDKTAVTEVQLTYPDRDLHLKKDEAGKWRITQPVDTEADETTVTNLVNAIADAEIGRILDEPVQDPALYGLNAPLVKLQVTLKDGKPLPQVSIGKDTPVGYSVYLQREGETKLLLTPQAFRLGMTKEVKDLRDKTVIALKPEEVKKIEIQSQNKSVVLAKADGGWMLEQPVSGKADDAQVQTFLSSVQNLKAQDFVEQPVLEPKDYGLAPPQLTVNLTIGADSAQKTLLVGSEKTQEKGGKLRHLKRGEKETLFLVGDWVLRDLDKSAQDFRDKTIARFAQDQAAKVEVKRQDGQNFTLTRGADKKWAVDKSGEGVFQEAAVTQLVSALSDLRGYEIAAENPADLAPYSLAAPAAVLSVYDEKDARLATVLVGQKAEGETKKTFAMTEGGKTIFALRDYVFDRLHKAPTDFWAKPVEKPAEQPAATEPATSSHPHEEEDLGEEAPSNEEEGE